MKSGKPSKEIAWGIQYVKDGKCSTIVDYARNTTPREAIASFLEKRGGRWEDYEKEGAKVVKMAMASWRIEPG